MAKLAKAITLITIHVDLYDYIDHKKSLTIQSVSPDPGSSLFLICSVAD